MTRVKLGNEREPRCQGYVVHHLHHTPTSHMSGAIDRGKNSPICILNRLVVEFLRHLCAYFSQATLDILVATFIYSMQTPYDSRIITLSRETSICKFGTVDDSEKMIDYIRRCVFCNIVPSMNCYFWIIYKPRLLGINKLQLATDRFLTISAQQFQRACRDLHQINIIIRILPVGKRCAHR